MSNTNQSKIKKVLKITPLEPLFFRGMSNFDLMGSSSTIESLPFPNPSTIYGAVFSEILRQMDKSTIKTFNSIKEDKHLHDFLDNYLNIDNIYYQLDGYQYITAPFDMFEFDNRYKIAFVNEKGVTLPLEKENTQVENKLIRFNNIFRYIDHESKQITADFTDVFDYEYKLGIKVDQDTRTSQDGMLYTQKLVRYKPQFSFIVEVTIKSNCLEEINTLKLGGESKYVKVEYVDNLPIKENLYNNYKSSYNYVKVVATTPWIIRKDDEVDKIEGLIHIDTITGKVETMGTFDIKNNRQSKLVKKIPSGTVFYYKVNDEKGKTLDEVDNIIQKQLDIRADKDTYGYSMRGFNKYIVLPGGCYD